MGRFSGWKPWDIVPINAASKLVTGKRLYGGDKNEAHVPVDARGLPIIGDYLDATDPTRSAVPNLNLEGLRMGARNAGGLAGSAIGDYNAASGVYEGPGIGATERVNVGAINPTVIDQGQSNQARNLQMSGIQQLQDIAAGRGPDVTSPALQAGMRATAGEALGAASAAAGGERAAARLEATQAIGRGGTDAAIAAAQLAAQRQMGAINQIGQQAGALRGQDIGVATSQGNLTSGEMLTGRGQDIGVSTGNADRNLNRDIAASGSDRADYLAGHTVKQGYGNLANTATGTQIQGEQAVSGAMGQGEAIARGQDAEDARRRAAGRQSLVDTGGKLLAAAHGGLVTKPTHVLAGEAGPELIVPVKADVGQGAKRNLSLEAQPFDRSRAPNLSALLGGQDDKSGNLGGLTESLLAGLLLDRQKKRAAAGGY